MALCRLAEQPYTNLKRWLAGDDPQIGVFGRTLKAIEAVLAAEELRIFAALAPKFLPPHIVDEFVASSPSLSDGSVTGAGPKTAPGRATGEAA